MFCIEAKESFFFFSVLLVTQKKKKQEKVEKNKKTTFHTSYRMQKTSMDRNKNIIVAIIYDRD